MTEAEAATPGDQDGGDGPKRVPIGLLLGWWGIRPFLSFLALTLPWLIGGISPVGFLIVVLALLLRPARHRWLGLMPIVLVAPFSVPAAVILAFRLLFTELILKWPIAGLAGETRRIEEIRAHFILTVPEIEIAESPEAAFGNLEAAVRARRGEIGSPVATYAATSWVKHRPRETIRALRIIVEALFRGRVLGIPFVDDDFDRMFLLEELATVVFRVVAVSALVLGATIFALVTDYSEPGVLPISPPDWLLLTTSVLLFGIWTTSEKLHVGRIMFGILLVVYCMPGSFWSTCGAALLIVILLRWAGARFWRLMVQGSRPKRRVSPAMGSPLFRHKWSLAERSAEAGQNSIAVGLLMDLAEEYEGKPHLERAAVARAALLELDVGRTGPAADLLDRLRSIPEGGDRGFTEAAQGILSLELGDIVEAEAALEAASSHLPASSPLYRRVISSLAETVTLAGDPDRAIELQGRIRGRAFGNVGLVQMLESETAIAAALAARGDGDAALERISEYTGNMGSFDENASFLAKEMRAGFALTESRARLLVGQMTLRQGGELVGAERDLRYALSRSAEALAGADRDQIRSSARILHGYALVRLNEAAEGAEEIEDGIGELEQRRLQLRSADRRTAMIVADEELYRWAFKGLVQAQNDGVEGAAMTGAKLIESLRRTAIAETLRSGQLPLSEDAKGLVGEIAELERSQGEDKDDERSGNAERNQVLRAKRHKLGGLVSDAFASAYLPKAVEGTQITDAAKTYGHLLSFHVPPGGLPAWRSWVAPDGSVEIAELWGDGSPTRESIKAWIDNPDSDPLSLIKPLSVARPLWENLAGEVLPKGLRDRLLNETNGADPERLVVVPDGPLSTFTWPALHVGGEPIISRASLALTPALDFLSGKGHPAKGDRKSRLVAHVVEGLKGSGSEVEVLVRSGDVEFVDSRDGFLAALDAGDLDGAYLAAHGVGMGLEQKVDFADDYSLSAAKALVHKWPPWTVFASCLVGKVDHQAGREPFGLAVSCMLGGTETFVSSLLEIPPLSAAEVCSGLAEKLATSDQYPPDILRDLQLQYMKSPGNQNSTIRHCLGLVCISSVPPPAA